MSSGIEVAVKIKFKACVNVTSQIDLQVYPPKFPVVSHSAHSDSYVCVKPLAHAAIIRYRK